MTLKIINNANVLAADTIAFTKGGAEAMRIDSSGNVGIKTTTPATELDISTGATTGGVKRYITLTSLNNSSAKIGYADIGVTFNQNNTGNESGGMNFRVMHNGTIRDRYYFGAGSNDVHAWYTGADTLRMLIDSSGNVLVGTTSANIGFTTGDKSINFNNAYGSAYAIGINDNTGGNGYFLGFGRGGTQVGYIWTNGANSTQYVTSSDYRLKENVQPMICALQNVLKLKPCTYTWKQDGTPSQGFIAHELQEVIPEAVAGEKDAIETYTDENGIEQTRIKPQGVDTSFLVATLAAAIQEQQAIIEELKARITSLESK